MEQHPQEFDLLRNAGFAHFRMCGQRDEKDLEPALGWALSNEARARIDGYIAADVIAAARDPAERAAFCAHRYVGEAPSCQDNNARALQTVVCGLAGTRPFEN